MFDDPKFTAVLSTCEQGTGAAAKKKHHRRRRSSTSQVQRARGYHPVAVNFGRPDIEKIISETILGTAIQAEWAPPAPPAGVGAPARPEAGNQPAPIAEVPPSRPVSGLRQVSFISPCLSM